MSMEKDPFSFDATRSAPCSGARGLSKVYICALTLRVHVARCFSFLQHPPLCSAPDFLLSQLSPTSRPIPHRGLSLPKASNLSSISLVVLGLHWRSASSRSRSATAGTAVPPAG